MNNTSSRSHAIFSVMLKQQYVVSSSTESTDIGNDQVSTAAAAIDDSHNKLHRSPSDQTLGCSSNSPHVKRLVSKFHFVDLAGSERVSCHHSEYEKEISKH